MHRELTIRPLTTRLTEKTYPFAQALGLPDLARWRRFVAGFAPRSDAAADRGALVAEDAHGYVCGLLFYQVNRRNKDGASLVCDPFLVADLPRYETPVRALLEEADRVALALDCKWVRVVLPATGDPLSAEGAGCEAALFRAGYALESLSFRRRRSLPVGTARPPGARRTECRPRLNAR